MPKMWKQYGTEGAEMSDIVVGEKVIGIGGHSGAGKRGVVIGSNPDEVVVLMKGQNCPVIISPQSFDSWFLKIKEPPDFYPGCVVEVEAIAPNDKITLYAPASMRDEIFWGMDLVYGLVKVEGAEMNMIADEAGQS